MPEYAPWALLALALASAIGAVLAVRWQSKTLVRHVQSFADRQVPRDPALEQDLAHIEIQLRKIIEAEAGTARLVTAIAENLVPALQHLNQDILDLIGRVADVQHAGDKYVDTAAVLGSRLEACDGRLTSALNDLLNLLSMSEGVVAEQRDKFQAIERALDAIGRHLMTSNERPVNSVAGAAQPLNVDGYIPAVKQEDAANTIGRFINRGDDVKRPLEENWTRGAPTDV